MRTQIRQKQIYNTSRGKNMAGEGETLLLLFLNKQEGLTNRVYLKAKVRDNLLRGKEGFVKTKKVTQTNELMTNYKNGG